MAHFLGTLAKVAVSADGVTYATVGDVVSASLSPQVNTVDSTDNDSSAKEYLPGDQDATFTFTFNYETNQGDTAQQTIVDAFFNKTTLYYRYRLREVSGESQFIFQGIITEMPVEQTHEEITQMSPSIQVTGGVAESAQ